MWQNELCFFFVENFDRLSSYMLVFIADKVLELADYYSANSSWNPDYEKKLLLEFID